MPNSATEKLLKILKHEVQMGYQDKAVTRGLASFAKAWLADAERSNIDPAWAASVADDMRAYSDMTDTNLRRAAMNALIQRLQAPQRPPAGAPTLPIGRRRRASRGFNAGTASFEPGAPDANPYASGTRSST